MAVDIFLKLEGINGESEDAKHTKEIDILGWNWGMSNTGTAHLGGGAGTGKVNIHDLSVTKYVDLASTPLMLVMSTSSLPTPPALARRIASVIWCTPMTKSCSPLTEKKAMSPTTSNEDSPMGHPTAVRGTRNGC